MACCEELTKSLAASVQRNRTDSLLLSGGLDSAIIASLARPDYAVTVGFGSGAPDIQYSRKVAGKFCRRHAVRILDMVQVHELVDKVIKSLKAFDPIAIRNSIVALAGLEQAKADGYLEIMSGDGGDELFAGYNYLSRYFHDHDGLDKELRRLWDIMHFSTNDLAAILSMRISSPLLDPLFTPIAKSIPVGEKVGIRDGRPWGKFILRTCFEKGLGELAWREKAAQEIGSGTWQISERLLQSVSDSEMDSIVGEAAGDGVVLRGKEHAYYYKIYRKYHEAPSKERRQCPERCPKCGGCFGPNPQYCRICGAFPVSPIRSF